MARRGRQHQGRVRWRLAIVTNSGSQLTLLAPVPSELYQGGWTRGSPRSLQLCYYSEGGPLCPASFPNLATKGQPLTDLYVEEGAVHTLELWQTFLQISSPDHVLDGLQILQLKVVYGIQKGEAFRRAFS